jgi:hypothetical protein
MVQLELTGIQLKLKQEEGKTYVFDPVRKKWLVLTPEEHVRQHLIYYLKDVLNYPGSLMSVEKKIMLGTLTKRFDIVVYNREHKPWMLIECKAPEIEITDAALHQLLQYHNSLQCRYWMLSNGHQNFCADAADTNEIKWIAQLPSYDS